jgi:hypothetical protein
LSLFFVATAVRTSNPSDAINFRFQISELFKVRWTAKASQAGFWVGTVLRAVKFITVLSLPFFFLLNEI